VVTPRSTSGRDHDGAIARLTPRASVDDRARRPRDGDAMPLVSAGHFLLGTEGLAVLRQWRQGDPAELARRRGEMVQFGGSTDSGPMSIRFELAELDVRDGYARWSTSYDGAPNPLIRAEQPVVRAMIDRVPPGVALDAACGTGRHTAHLVERGHRTTGIDATPEMLARARARVPAADLREGRLESLPLEPASVDLAVCALALTHVRDLRPALHELARVLRPGGRLVVSDLHPTMVLLGGTAFFVGADGTAGNVQSYHHPLSSYLAAFREAGLAVVDCVEPAIAPEDLPALSGGLAAFAEEAFRAAWVGVPNAIVWELARPA
jgi:ubiquinone/menaquinone biosynthesis C-methylase UbiE